MRGLRGILVGGAVACIAIFAWGACSTFEGEDERDAGTSSETGASDANEAGSSDATDAGDARRDAGDADPSVVIDDDFSSNTPSCGYSAYAGTLNPAPGQGRDGGSACAACLTSGNNYYGLEVDGLELQPGHRYYGEAWVRDDSQDAGARSSFLRFAFAEDGGTAEITGTFAGPSTAWQQIQINAVPRQNPVSLLLIFFAQRPPTCSYIDHLYLRRID